MQLQTVAESEMYPLLMLQKMRVNTDGGGITAEEFEAGQEAMVPFNTAIALVRDGKAKFKGKKPREIDTEQQALLEIELRKKRALRGFTLTKVDGPLMQFTAALAVEDKLHNLALAALFFDLNKWGKLRGYESFDPDLLPKYQPVQETLLSAYIANPESKEIINHVVPAFAEALQGGANQGFRLELNNVTEKHLHICLHSPFGPGLGLFVVRQERLNSLQLVNGPVQQLASDWTEPAIDIWLYQLREWTLSACGRY